MKQKERKHSGPAARRAKRAGRATPEPIVVTDDNLDEVCERLNKLPKRSKGYDRIADVLHRYMLG